MAKQIGIIFVRSQKTTKEYGKKHALNLVIRLIKMKYIYLARKANSSISWNNINNNKKLTENKAYIDYNVISYHSLVFFVFDYSSHSR